MYRRVTFAAIVAVAAALGIGAAPAVAADSSAPTTVTFAVTAGGLTITAPATAALGSGVTGGTITGNLGMVRVTDQRGLLAFSWTASVASTTYVTGAGGAGQVIQPSAVTYTSPALPTIVSGVPVPVKNLLLTTLTTAPQTVYTATGLGSNAVEWNPSLTVAVPAGAVAGNYTGTVTHSVA
ncbi:hypothetical protein [Asanoa siamensis]|uniref:Uncharacterized protein n=1 Tax=Asanoa siamensis TaxID=926357 RepID=A0ABQ4CQV2_9ACTN|nr:hypothetical protein [Asanoa siamensis]GIF73655.1 hypothetical protein Asi02nite_31730 [Asanoa siamensis]